MERFDFNFDPLCVGDTSTLGLAEELLEQQVDDAIDFLYREYDGSPTVEDIDDAISQFDIDYSSLPGWLADKFDQFEV